MLYVNIHIVSFMLQGNLKNSNKMINLHQNHFGISILWLRIKWDNERL